MTAIVQMYHDNEYQDDDNDDNNINNNKISMVLFGFLNIICK